MTNTPHQFQDLTGNYQDSHSPLDDEERARMNELIGRDFYRTKEQEASRA